MLPAVGARGWVFITEDRRIRYRSAERAAYLEAELRMFALATGNLATQQKLEVLLKAEEQIRRVLATGRAPFLYRVAKDGRLRELE